MKLKTRMNNRGQAMQGLASLATGIAAFAIVVVVTFLILAEGTDQVGSIEGISCTGNYSTDSGGGGTSKACNATHAMQSAVDDLPDWVPLIVVAAIGAILLAMVRTFSSRR